MDTPITAQRLITIEITQHQALNLAASIASDFRSAIDFMPEDFKKRHQELFDLLLAELTDEEKTRVLRCMPDQGGSK